jgi:hypothetical protein
MSIEPSIEFEPLGAWCHCRGSLLANIAPLGSAYFTIVRDL